MNHPMPQILIQFSSNSHALDLTFPQLGLAFPFPSHVECLFIMGICDIGNLYALVNFPANLQCHNLKVLVTHDDFHRHMTIAWDSYPCSGGW